MDYQQQALNTANQIAAQPYQPYVTPALDANGQPQMDASGQPVMNQIPRIADFSTDQLASQQMTRDNQGAYQPIVSAAAGNLAGVNPNAGFNAANPYFSSAYGVDPMASSAGYYGSANTASGNTLDISGQLTQAAGAQGGAQAAGGYYNSAASMSPSSAASGYLSAAQGMSPSSAASGWLGAAGGINPTAMTAPYLQQALGQTGQTQGLIGNLAGMGGDPNGGAGAFSHALSMSGIGSASPYLGQAQGQNGAAAGAPMFNQAASINGASAAGPYVGQAAGINAMGNAAGNLGDAAQRGYNNVQNYYNPYEDRVIDRIGDLGARQLREKLIPAAGDQFTRAGQFGSARMQESVGRALRDTNESVLAQQSQLANQGYQNAMTASQADAARLAQIGQTQGQISLGQQQNLGQLGQTMGGLTGQQQSNLANIGSSLGGLTNQYGAMLGNLGQTAGQLTNQEAATAANVGQAQGNIGNQAAGISAQSAASAANASNQLAQMLGNLGIQSGQLGVQQMNALGNLGQTAGTLNLGEMNALGNLGQTAGTINLGQMNALGNLGQSYGNLTNQQNATTMQGLSSAGNLSNAAASNYGNLAQASGNLGVNYMGALGNIGQSAGTLTNTGNTNMINASTNMANMGNTLQTMGLRDQAALDATGTAQQNMDQRNLDLAYQDFQNQTNYQRDQLGWLSNQMNSYEMPTSQDTSATGPLRNATYQPSGLNAIASGLGGILAAPRKDGGSVTYKDMKRKRAPLGALAMAGC